MAIFQASLIGKGVTLITPVADGELGEVLTTNGAGQLELGALIATFPGAIVVTDGTDPFGVIERQVSANGGMVVRGGNNANPSGPLELDGTGIVMDAAGGIYFIDHADQPGDDDKEFLLKLGPQQTLPDGRIARAMQVGGEVLEIFTEQAVNSATVNLTGTVEATIVTLVAGFDYSDPAAFKGVLHLGNSGSQTVQFIVRVRLNGALQYESDPISLSNGSWLWQNTVGMQTFPGIGDTVTLTVEADLSTGNRNPLITGVPDSEIALTQLSTGGGGGGGSQATAFYFGT